MNDGKYIISWIGSKLRELRTLKEWNLGELSERSGVSIPMISKIENGRVFPTFPTLLRILRTLEVDLNRFFEDIGENEEFPGYIYVKRDAYVETRKEDSVGFKYETILAHNVSDISLEISMLTLSRGAKRERVSTEGYEFIFMVKGNIEYQLGEETFNLKEGDSLYFDGRTPHVPRNNGHDDAILLIIYLINEL